LEELQLRLSKAKSEEILRDVIQQLRDDVPKARWSTYRLKMESEPELINYRFWLSLGDRFKSAPRAVNRQGTTPSYRRRFLRRRGRNGDGLTQRSVAKAHLERKTRNVGNERFQMKLPA
jgi:hypothetical protein